MSHLIHPRIRLRSNPAHTALRPMAGGRRSTGGAAAMPGSSLPARLG